MPVPKNLVNSSSGDIIPKENAEPCSRTPIDSNCGCSHPRLMTNVRQSRLGDVSLIRQFICINCNHSWDTMTPA